MSRLFKAALAFCLLAAALSCTAAQGLTWRRVTTGGNRQPSPRMGFAFGYDPLSNRLIVFGGRSANGVVNDTWIFDVASGNWSEVRPLQAPAARSEAYFGVLRVSGMSLFVVTHGFGRDEYDDVWVFRFSTQQWYQTYPSGNAPGARYGGQGGAAYGDTDTLWVGSGFTFTTPLATRYIDTYKLRFTGLNESAWELVYPQPSIGNQFMPLSPHGRCLQASAVLDDNEGLVIAGGCMRGGTGGGPCPTDDTWFFNDSRRAWRELPRCITPRVWSGMAALSDNPGRAVLYGGNDMFSKQLLYVAAYPEQEVFVVNVMENQWVRYWINATEYPGRRARFGMVAAMNNGIYVFGGQNLSGGLLNDLWWLSGDLASSTEIACNNVWFSYAHLHGILMFLAFGLLFPLGIAVAQTCRCKGSKAWFIIHVCIQITAVLLAIAGFIMIFAVSQGAGQIPTHPHAIVGIALMFFMFIQPINGIFRPHVKEGEDKSKYRVCWEWFHRIYGFFVLLLGFTQVTLGVFLIVPPQPVWVTAVVVLGSWLIFFIIANVIRAICCCFCKRDQDEDYMKDEGHEMKNMHP